METIRVRRPRISRETRLVVLTALIALVALWVLARIRFPSAARDSTPPQVLAPLSVRPAFEAFAARVAAASGVAGPRLISIEIAQSPIESGSPAERRSSGWRFRDDLALVHLPAAARPTLEPGATLVAHSPSLELAVVRMPGRSPIPPVGAAWPERLQTEPRYVLATNTLAGGVSLRPVWIGGADAVESPLWSATLFEVPYGTDLAPGHLVYGSDGDWLGLTIAHGTNVAIVPAAIVIREVEELLARAARPAGDLQTEVQPLVPSIMRATGASSGVIVAWIAKAGPASGILQPGDVIEAADGQALPTIDHWLRYQSQLVAGTPTSITIRRNRENREVTLTPAPVATAESPAAKQKSRPLGLVMRFIPGSGSEITAVEPASLGAFAGFEPGDVITWIGSTASPEPMQIRQIVSATAAGHPLMAGVQRGAHHRVTTLER